jgi:hypothetical protein
MSRSLHKAYHRTFIGLLSDASSRCERAAPMHPARTGTSVGPQACPQQGLRVCGDRGTCLRQIEGRPARDRKVRPGRFCRSRVCQGSAGRMGARSLAYAPAWQSEWPTRVPRVWRIRHACGPTEVPVPAGCLGGALSQREDAWLPMATSAATRSLLNNRALGVKPRTSARKPSAHPDAH